MRKEWRGKGVGRRLMDFAMSRLGDRCVILDAAQDKYPMYEAKWGFKLKEPVIHKLFYDVSKLASIELSAIQSTNTCISNIDRRNTEDVITYDQSISNNDRQYKDALMQMWMESENSLVKLCAVQLDNIVGYIVVRHNPILCMAIVSADDGNIAEMLLVQASKHLATLKQPTVFMNTPVCNLTAMKTISQAKMESSLHYDFRMVKGNGPDLDWSRVFGYSQTTVNII